MRVGGAANTAVAGPRSVSMAGHASVSAGGETRSRARRAARRGSWHRRLARGGRDSARAPRPRRGPWECWPTGRRGSACSTASTLSRGSPPGAKLRQHLVEPTPSDQMSVRWSTREPRACSGDMGRRPERRPASSTSSILARPVEHRPRRRDHQVRGASRPVHDADSWARASLGAQGELDDWRPGSLRGGPGAPRSSRRERHHDVELAILRLLVRVVVAIAEVVERGAARLGDVLLGLGARHEVRRGTSGRPRAQLLIAGCGNDAHAAAPGRFIHVATVSPIMRASPRACGRPALRDLAAARRRAVRVALRG